MQQKHLCDSYTIDEGFCWQLSQTQGTTQVLLKQLQDAVL